MAAAPIASRVDEPEPAGVDHAPGGLRALIRDRLLGHASANEQKPAPVAAGPQAYQRIDSNEERRTGPRRAFEPFEEEEAYETGRSRNDEIWRPLIDPMKVIMGVVNSKMLIASTTVLGMLLGVAIALSTPKKYESAAELLVDPRDLKLVDRDLTQAGLPSDATLAIVENQARVLTSGSVLNKVVDKLNLSDDPEFNGESGGGIGSIISDLRSLLSRRDASEGGDRKRALAVEHLAESLSVERGGKTFVIVVAVTTEDPEKSALIANTMTDVFLQTYGELQSDTAGRASDELSARLDELRGGLEEAERKVETYKAENDLIDAQGRLITDDEIVKLNEQLSIARARTIELNAKAASSRGVDVDDALGGALPEELNSNVMTELRSQYAALRQEADRISVRLGPRHPERLAAEAQLAGARGQIANELRRIISSTQTELKRAVQLEQELSARLAQLKVRQGSVSDDLVTLRELEREASAKRAVYEAFLLRAKETGEQRDINTANMSVISRAFAPFDPIGPSRSMIALTGAMLGFLAGAGLGGARGAWQGLRESATTRPRRTIRPRSAATSDTSPPEPPEPKDPARRTPPRVPPLADDVHYVERPVRETARPAENSRPASGWLSAFRRAHAEQAPVGKDRSGSADQAPHAAASHVTAPPAPATVTSAHGEPPQADQPVPASYHQPQQPAYAQPMMPQQGTPQQAVYAPQFVPVYPQPPMPAYPAMQQAWPPSPHGFPQPMSAAYPAQSAPMYPVQDVPQPYPMYQQPVFQQPVQVPVRDVPPFAETLRQQQRYAANDRTTSSIEEIRDSLRDFREAVRELAESRSRRRSI